MGTGTFAPVDGNKQGMKLALHLWLNDLRQVKYGAHRIDHNDDIRYVTNRLVNSDLPAALRQL